MNRHQRTLATIRIVVLLLVGLAFLIARLAHGQAPTAAELAKKETVASAFTRGFGYQEYQVRSAAEVMPEAYTRWRETPPSLRCRHRRACDTNTVGSNQ